MSDDEHRDGPHWLDEFEDFANRQLEEGSSCEQVHPIVRRWLDALPDDGPEERDSIEQAMACLSSEMIGTIPDAVYEAMLSQADEDTIAAWVEYVLRIGRRFEQGLNKGELDDL
jgi:hypothetical protein